MNYKKSNNILINKNNNFEIENKDKYFYFLKNKKFKNRIWLFLIILAIFIFILISTAIAFHTTYVEYKIRTPQTIIKHTLIDWFTYWSEWSITIASFSITFILFPFYYLILFTSKNIYSINLIYKINCVNLMYLLLTFIIYNGTLLLKPDQIFNNPDGAKSLLEHFFSPIAFLIYFIISNKYIKLKENNYKNAIKIIYKNLKISSILIILYCCVVLIINKFLPYGIIDYRSLGWTKVIERLILFTITYSTIFYLININVIFKWIKFKKLNNKKDKLKNVVT